MAAARETKREKFKRIAVARTNKAAEMIRLLGNCSNTGSYEYTQDEVKQIFSYLEAELKKARAKFDGGSNSTDAFVLK